MMYLILINAIFVAEQVYCELKGLVLGGDYTNIQQYPHSVYLSIACKFHFICGGSILNQNVVLSAGHCLEECKLNSDTVIVKYGHEQLSSMATTSMRSFKIHENYDQVSMHNDICLVLCNQPIKLGRHVKRIAVMRRPNDSKWAYIAGWGVMNTQKDLATILKHTIQQLQPPEVCKLLGSLPAGTFCAGPISGIGAPDQGDSGSALVVYNYIQIGIVSYKIDRYSLVVYTNVSYHYNWITKNANAMFCKENKG